MNTAASEAESTAAQRVCVRACVCWGEEDAGQAVLTNSVASEAESSAAWGAGDCRTDSTVPTNTAASEAESTAAQRVRMSVEGRRMQDRQF